MLSSFPPRLKSPMALGGGYDWPFRQIRNLNRGRDTTMVFRDRNKKRATIPFRKIDSVDWDWADSGFCLRVQVQESSYYINDRQHSGSLSNVLSRLAVEVRVDGDELVATGSGVSTMLAESSSVFACVIDREGRRWPTGPPSSPQQNAFLTCGSERHAHAAGFFLPSTSSSASRRPPRSDPFVR